ncbi:MULTISPECIES: NAD-dependent epimerase/dehydratase family protein [Bizionia]|uniref:NAD-dependent epimerase/dehydratase family protein n=1 Tax=Bizionia algoritergicola TaxID=291187 RepID=A0A5D0QZT7_9FLAO|nr:MULTISPECIES: NAD-dependent epimerase/dehydratase family protein [Bizionia]OBX23120.1 NAD-dependent epimerase [Bizionia sp. APA-3]TYB74782.1 NAD-dependent epimerase/dehydratase family protein [Bizionia algoritergicola]
MILVTGGTGLVGSHLLYQLVADNKAVRAIYRTEAKQDIVKRVFSYYTQDYDALFNKIEWIEADLLDIPQLTEAFKNIEYVYHCAAMVSFAPNDYHKLRKTNIEGTTNMVNLCISNHVKKLCYVSSVATIGDSENNRQVDEETNWNPEKDNNVYAITKYGAEIEVWRGTQEGLDAVIVNPGVIIGAGIWNHGSGEIFKQVHEGLSFYTKGHIACVNVSDVVKSMILLLENTIKNERYILVAEHIPYQTFLATIATSLHVKPPHIEAKPWMLSIAWRLDWLKNKLTGKPRKLVKPMLKSTLNKTVYDNTKIKTQLDFQFTPMDSTIDNVAKAFLKNL